MPANWKLTPSKCLVSVSRISTIEEVAAQGSVRGQRPEAVVRDQAQASALAQALDPVREEHRVRIAVARADAADPQIGLALSVQACVDLLLPLRLASAVRRITDHGIELDLVDRTKLIHRRVDADHPLRLREQLALPLRRVEQHVVHVELRPRLNGLLAQQEKTDRRERERERVDIAAVDLLLDDLTIDGGRGKALAAV